MHSASLSGDGGIHYHICWADPSGPNIDWQVFDSPAEARASAENLARPGEAFTVEGFGDNCWRCAELITTAHEKAKTQ